MQHNRTSLFGYGVTTRAIAKAFGPCTFYDDNVHKPFTDEAGNKVRPTAEFDPRYSDLEIPSPGIPPEHPLIRKAGHLVSEYDLFLSPLVRPPYTPSVKPFTVWITGTNGKTTTTQMLTHLLADKGALSGGNIGTPLAALDTAAPLWVLETSSFTLHYTHEAKPDLYVVLPITPDHLSWHGSEQAYIDDKLKPLAQMREGETVLLPRAYADTPTDAFVIPYDDADDLAAFFGFETDHIRFKGPFLLDALLAMAVDRILFDRIDYAKMNAFVLDPHRQEEFSDAQNRLWVNDTKATNIDAALAAVRRYANRPIHLIVGGDDKGVDMAPLFEALADVDVTLYTIGSNQAKLDALSERFGIPFESCGVLTEAVKRIADVHTQQSVGLLSPACASLDQFPSYAVRGNTFKEAVANLS
ncbi:UDP-N-acetylmuramoyl-L-alanine--D-glutamate ligase [Thiomicrolovo sp. ZZH C-3]